MGVVVIRECVKGHQVVEASARSSEFQVQICSGKFLFAWLLFAFSIFSSAAVAQVVVNANVAGVFTRAAELMDCDVNGGSWESRSGDGGIPYCYAPPKILLNDANILTQVAKGLARYSSPECTPPYIAEDTGWTTGDIPVPPELHEYFTYWDGKITSTEVVEVRRILVQPSTYDVSNRQCGLGTARYFGVVRHTLRLKDSCCARGNPTLVGLGSKIEKVDLTSSSSIPMVISYSSLLPGASSAQPGANWTHTYDQTLRYTAASGPDLDTVLIRGADRGLSVFQRQQGSTAWTPLPPTRGQLWKMPSSGGLFKWVVALEGVNDMQVFDSSGNLIQTTSLAGEIVSLEYSQAAEARLERATDSMSGRSIKFSYDAGGQLVRIDNPNGTSVGLASAENLGQGVAPQGQLTRIIHEDGTSTGFYYEDVRFPVALTGILGGDEHRFSSYQYDSSGRVSSTGRGEGASAGRREFSYQANSTLEMDSLGASRAFEFQNINLVRREISASETSPLDGSTYTRHSEYDLSGNPISRDDLRGNRVCTSFDTVRNLMLVRVDGIDAVTACTAILANAAMLPAGARKTSSRWHPILRLVEAVAHPGEIVTYVFNGRPDPSAGGALAACAPPEAMLPNGSPIAVVCKIIRDSTIDESGSQGFLALKDPNVPSRVETMRYNEKGQLLARDGARIDVSDTSAYVYYPSDDAVCGSTPTTCPHRKGDLWKVTDALGHITEMLKYDGAGRMLSVKDPNGLITDLEYHPRGWLAARKVRGTDNTVETDDQITRIDYWPTGLVKKVTQPDGAFTSYTYDAAHRLTDIADNASNTIHYTLDNAGNRLAEDTKDNTGALRRTLSRVYNQLGQLATQADASGNPTDLTYDANGNTDTVTDALGQVTDNDYDPLNRLSRTLQDVGGISAETKFAYDAQDHLTKVTDPKGLDTTYTYNGFGDQTSQSSPDTGTTTYSYDSAGNRAAQTDARGVIASYRYDALNRLIGVSYPDSTRNLSYTYDFVAVGCPADEQFAQGRLGKAKNAGTILRYCYDRFGNVTRKFQDFADQHFQVLYTYTLAGQLRSVTYPDGAIVDYARDTQGRITEIGATPVSKPRRMLLSQATYAPFGPAADWTYGNGRSLLRSHDLNYQPQTIRDGNAGGLSLHYTFDAVGNLTQLEDGFQTGILARYGYDALDRLHQTEDGPTGTPLETYGYDATGNRTSLTNAGGVATYTYPATSHRLAQVGSVPRSYDAAGNTTQIGGTAREFVHDDTGRMRQTKIGGTVAMQYDYDARGEQVRRYPTPTSTAQVYTVYDEAGHWLGDYDSTGAALQQAIWMDDMPVGLFALGGAGLQTVYYVEPDHLGTPRVVINPNTDKAVWSWDATSEAFGNSPPNQDPDGDGTAFVFDMRFPGQRYDAASGLNYNYFRDYEAATGRYPQSDPTGVADGPSTYGYVRQNPLGLIDTHGNAARPSAAQNFKQQAEQARAEAVAKMQSCKPGDCSKVPDTYNFNEQDRQEALANLAIAKIVFDGSSGDCGYVESVLNPNVITIGGPTLSGRCCSLAAVIAHEAFHLGRDGRDGRGTEERARFIQQQCFGCTKAFK